MLKTMVELWNGSFSPVERLGKDNASIRKAEILLRRHLKRLGTSLGQEQAELFERYSDCMNEYLGLMSEQAFCDGFSIGVKLTAEAMENAEKLL